MSAVFTNRILPFSSGEQSGALAIDRVVLGDLWLTILNLWGWDLDSKTYDFYFLWVRRFTGGGARHHIPCTELLLTSTPHNYHLDSDENMSGTPAGSFRPLSPLQNLSSDFNIHRKICLAQNFLLLKNTAANPSCEISSAEPSAGRFSFTTRER